MYEFGGHGLRENISALIFLAGERSIGVSWLPRGSAIRFECMQQSTVLFEEFKVGQGI